MNLPPTINKYQIVHRLGNGSFGEVFRVVDRALQAEKAIKIFQVPSPANFIASLEEAQILNGCRHKHIVEINEANVFDVNGQPCAVLDLEYVAEGSLEHALNTRWISVREAVQYVRGALRGLEHAHTRNFLHRDIKPGNILLHPRTPKLSDFGLATDTASNLIGSARGYTTHLPPEFFTSHQTTVASDVYAAGVTLFRAVENIRDWHSVVASVRNSQRKIESGKLIESIGFHDHTPKPLIKIVRKACNPDPNRRIKSAAAFGQELDKLRFAVDWIQLGNLEWEGRRKSDVYRMEVNPRNFRLTFAKNGRKQKSNCAKYSTLSEAVAAMHTQVASSTLS